jgi:hypothetical protein
MRRDHGSSNAMASAVLALAAGFGSQSAWAQQRAVTQGFATPSAPISNYDFAAPTPAQIVPPFPYLSTANGESLPENAPPFDRPLPPAIQLPPPIRIPRAMPPPIPDEAKNPVDVVRTVPQVTGRPAPFRLPERPDEAEPPAGGFRQSLSELDRRLGLGSAGPIVTAARQLAQSEWMTGRATLAILADRTGRIQSVRVVDSSGDVDGWRRYSEELRGAERAGMRLPEQARGLWTLLDIRVTNELSSGHTRWWAPGLIFNFELADVNARRLRTVHTQVISEVWY